MSSRMPKRTAPHEAHEAILCTAENPYKHSRRLRRRRRRNAKNVLNLGVRWPEIIAVHWFCSFPLSAVCCYIFSSFVLSPMRSSCRTHTTRSLLRRSRHYRTRYVKHILAASTCGVRLSVANVYLSIATWSCLPVNSSTASLWYGRLYKRVDLLGESPARPHISHTFPSHQWILILLQRSTL